MRRFLASFLEIIEVTLVAIGAVFLIRNFLFQPFLVSGSSMIPTFSNGDYLLIDELTYRFRKPERGEVVVFHFPKDERTFFIKRIIGLPNETVIIRDGKITIVNKDNPEGIILREPYFSSAVTVSGNIEVQLGADEYFVLGDNRSFSYDSRNWGALKFDDIVGFVRLRLWPLTDIRAFAAPEY